MPDIDSSLRGPSNAPMSPVRVCALAAALMTASCIDVGDIRTSCETQADCRTDEACCSGVCTPGGCTSATGGGSGAAGGTAGGAATAGGATAGGATAGGATAGGATAGGATAGGATAGGATAGGATAGGATAGGATAGGATAGGATAGGATAGGATAGGATAGGATAGGATAGGATAGGATAGGATAGGATAGGATAGGAASFTVTPTSWDAGDLSSGASVQQSFSVINTGGVTLGTVTAVQGTSPAFSTIDGCNQPLAVGARCSFDVRFSPGAAQSYSTQVVVSTTTSGVSPIPVLVSGRGHIDPTITIVVRNGPDAGLVFSTDGGLSSCATTCSAVVPLGTPITLGATANPFWGLLAWEDGTCSGSGQCSFVATQTTHLITAHFERYNRAFITSQGYPGNLGGAAGADALCVAAAVDAGLSSSSARWIALLNSDSTGQSAIARLGAASSWVRTDGRPFVDDAQALVTGPFWYPLVLDERARVSTTGTLDFWVGNLTATGGSDCNNWLSSSATVNGGLGYYVMPPTVFGDGGVDGCDSPKRLACFEGAVARPTLPAPEVVTGARRAFLSRTRLVGTSVVTLGDATCRDEATDAGLPNAARFQALYATVGQTPASRFNLLAPTWYRVDGVQVFTAATDLGASTRVQLAPIDVHANGQQPLAMVPGEGAWVGADPAVAGTSLSTCGGWVASTANGQRGYPHQYNANFNAGSVICTTPNWLYCLEN